MTKAPEHERTRPGPLGGVEEREFCDQRGLPYPDPVSAIRAVLRSVRMSDPVQIVTREYDATGGFVLTDHMVTRLEVLNAVSRLPSPLRETVESVELRGHARRESAVALGVRQSMVGEYLDAAYEAMVAMVFDYDCGGIRSGHESQL